MQKILLLTELGCHSDMRVSVRSSQRIKGVKDESNHVVEESVARVRSRVRVMCSIKSTGEIGLQLEFGSASDLRVSARMSLRFTVK